jgi:translin
MISKADLKSIQTDLTKWDTAREHILKISRSATRLAGWTIVQIHRNQLGKAKKTLLEARGQLSRLRELLDNSPGFALYGNAVVAFQEYTEAASLLELVEKGSIPTKRQVGVESLPYVLGLLDFTGEMRRMILDKIRAGKTSEAEKLLVLMEGVYEDLLSLDKVGMVPNFRRKMDVARRLIEATRGDLATELRRSSLEKSIRRLERRLS